MEEITLKRYLFHSKYFLEEDDSEMIKDEFLYIRENEWLRRNQQFTIKPTLFKYNLEFAEDIDKRIAEDKLTQYGTITSFILGFVTFLLGAFGLLMFEAEHYLNKYFVLGVFVKLSVIAIGVVLYDTVSLFELVFPFASLIKSMAS